MISQRNELHLHIEEGLEKIVKLKSQNILKTRKFFLPLVTVDRAQQEKLRNSLSTPTLLKFRLS